MLSMERGQTAQGNYAILGMLWCAGHMSDEEFVEYMSEGDLQRNPVEWMDAKKYWAAGGRQEAQAELVKFVQLTFEGMLRGTTRTA